MRHASDDKPPISRARSARSAILLACVLGLLVAAVLALSGSASASLQSQLNAKQSKLDKVEQKKGVLTTTISRYSDQISGLENQVAALQNREAQVQQQLDVKQAELDRAEQQLHVEKVHLVALRSHLKRALGSLRDRLVAIYETNQPDVLTVLLQSSGWNDLISRTTYLDRVNEQNTQLVSRVRDLRNASRDALNHLREAKNQIETARNAIAAQKTELEHTRTTLNGRKGALLDARGKRRAALDKVVSHEKQLDGDVSKIQSKIAAQLAPTGALPAGPIRAGSGQMIWPVNGPIVSGYGPRTINGAYEFHPGVDIAVPSGTPIRAAASGTVAFTEPESASGGYGNYTCIDHGGGLSTCYAHQETFAVQAGQSVSQGQVIGYSDCTGYCFGPHVHFEVRINGATTDPMAYL